MSYYRTCPYCGANLDPGERCDCRREQEANCHALANLQQKGLPGVTSTEQANGPKQPENQLCPRLFYMIGSEIAR